MILTFIPVSSGNGNYVGTRERCGTNLKANEVLGKTTSVALDRRRRGARLRLRRTLNSVLACRVHISTFFGIQAWPARSLDGRRTSRSGPVTGTKMAFSVVLPAFQWSADVVDGGSGFQATADVNGQVSDSLEHSPNQATTREQIAENDAKRRLARSAPVPTIVLCGLEDALRLRLLGVLLQQVLRLPNPPDKQLQRVGVILSTYMAEQLGLVWNEQEEDWRVASNVCADTLSPSLCAVFESDQVYYQVSDQCANRALLMPKLENFLKRRARNQVGTSSEDPNPGASPSVRAENAPSPVNIFDVQAAYGMDYIFICSPEKEEPHVVAETLARTESSLQLYALVSVVDAATARGIFTPTLRRTSTANASAELKDSVHPPAPAASAAKDHKSTAEATATGHESATETAQAAPAESAPVTVDTRSERPQESGTDPSGDSETPQRHHKMDRQRGSANRAQADNLVQLLVDQIEYANVVVVHDGDQSSGDCLSTASEQTSANESLAGAASIEKQRDEAAVHDVLRYLRLLNCEAQVISMNAGNEWPQVLLERILERPFEPERLLWMPTWRRVLASYAAAELAKTSTGTTSKETEAMRVTSTTPGVAADTAPSVSSTPRNTAAPAPSTTATSAIDASAGSMPGPGDAKSTAHVDTVSGGASAHGESADSLTTSTTWGSRFSNEHFLAALHSGTRPWERGMNPDTVRPETSFLYRADRPFHPRRLFDRISDISTFDGVLRSVGKLWLANRMDVCLEWSQVGNNITLKRGPRFFVTLPVEQWPTAPDSRDPLRPLQWDDRFGDRCSEIVFLGEDLDTTRIQLVLDECLLRDEELVFTEAWNEFEDPFESLVPHTDASRSSEVTPAPKKPSFLDRLASQIPEPWKLTLFTDARLDAHLEQAEHVISPGDVEPLPPDHGVVMVCGTPGSGKTCLLEAIASREDVEVWRLDRPVTAAFQAHARAQTVMRDELPKRLAEHPHPFRLFVETDWPCVAADTVITVVDCLRLRPGDPLEEHLVAIADTIVLSKSDLVSAQRLVQVLEYLCSRNARARVVRAIRCHVQRATVWVRRRPREPADQTPTRSALSNAAAEDEERNADEDDRAAAPGVLANQAPPGEHFQRYHLRRKRLMDNTAFTELLRMLRVYTDTLYAVGYMRPAETAITLPIEFDSFHIRIYSRPVMSTDPQLSIDLTLYADGVQLESLRSFFDDITPGANTP